MRDFISLEQGMGNPFQEQLLKAGLVNQQQVDKVNQEKRRKNKQQRQKKKGPVVDENRQRLQQAAKQKADRDRELNLRKEEQARNKAISNEINELIKQHRIARDEGCEVPYNFEHQGKVKRLYINESMRLQILQGKLGIARIEGKYELVPASVAKKIRQRNEKRVLLFDGDEAKPAAEDDPYAQYTVPDDLIW